VFHILVAFYAVDPPLLLVFLLLLFLCFFLFLFFICLL
jgi:hypothetical protein